MLYSGKVWRKVPGSEAQSVPFTVVISAAAHTVINGETVADPL